MAWFKKTSPVKQFWTWFVENETDLFQFEQDQSRVFDALCEQLQRISPNLTFEFGPVEDGRRDFVISAAGIRAAFPAVISLADEAPELRRWTIIRFRPRRSPICDLSYADTTVRAADVEFAILSNGEKIGLRLFIPGYSKDQHVHWGQIGYLLLDEALGEYDVETKVGMIEFHPFDATSQAQRHSLNELPRVFDEVAASLRSPDGRKRD